MVIDGASGQILASQWVVADIKDGDDGGGTKRRAASAVAQNGHCFALKCSEDHCRCDGNPTASCKFEAFPAVKNPVYVPLLGQRASAQAVCQNFQGIPEFWFADFDDQGYPVWDGELPEGCTAKVINDALRIASLISTEGIGERTPANGFLLMVGRVEEFNDTSSWHVNARQKYPERTTLEDIFTNKQLMTNFKSDFINIKAIAISGEDGRLIHHLIAPNGYERGFLNEQERFRCARDVAAKHKCFTISCARAACGTDGNSVGSLNVFPGHGACITIATKKKEGTRSLTFNTREAWHSFLSSHSTEDLSGFVIFDKECHETALMHQPDYIVDRLNNFPHANAELPFPLRLVHHDDKASFMYIILEPPMTFGDASRARVAQQMYAVTQKARYLIRDGTLKCPVWVADAEHARENMVELALADVIVWCGEGIPIDGEEGARETSMDILKLLQSVSLFVVCLKHGALQAAKFLQAELPCPVIWFAADMISSRCPDHLFSLMSFAVEEACSSRLTSKTLEPNMMWKSSVERKFEQMTQEYPLLETEILAFDMLCNRDQQRGLRSLMKRATSQKEGANSCSCFVASNRVYATNLLQEALDGLELLECDREEPARVCQLLKKEKEHSLQLTGKASQSLSRCRSVAFEVCKALLRSYDYDIIWRIASEHDFEILKNKLLRSRGKPARPLLWVDDGIDAQSMDAERVRAETAEFAADIHLLVTSPQKQSSEMFEGIELTSSSVGEEIKAKDTRRFCLVLKCCSGVTAGDIKKKLLELFLSSGLPDVTVHRMYEDGGWTGQDHAVAVYLQIPRVQNLQHLCNLCLCSGLFDKAFDPIVVDATRFAEAYDQVIQSIDRLTVEQQEVLTGIQKFFEQSNSVYTLYNRCHWCDGVRVRIEVQEKKRRAHLQAAAGAGKTFIAIGLMLDVLLGQQSASASGSRKVYLDGKCISQSHMANILFMSASPSLCYHVVWWLAARVREHGYTWNFFKDALLPRIHILCCDPDRSDSSKAKPEPQQLHFNPTTQILEPSKARANHLHAHDQIPSNLSSLIKEVLNPSIFSQYELIIVDEAHNLGRQLGAMVKSTEDATRVLFLTDESQSVTPQNWERFFAPMEHRFMLSKVVRSSKRVMAAARAFRLSRDPAVLEEVLDDALDGRPLKTYIFEGDGLWERLTENSYNRYAEEVGKAISDLKLAFSALDFHNRLAIIVPDKKFRDGLVAKLELRTLKFVTALEASQKLDVSSRPLDEQEWCVVDSVDNFAGLERLIVIAVGLDRPSNLLKSAATARCHIFQALTRAQMTAIVVNASIAGGWLEHLRNVELKQRSYDDELERASVNLAAAAEAIQDSMTATALSHRQDNVEASENGLEVEDEALWETGVWDPSGNSVGPANSLSYNPLFVKQELSVEESAELESLRSVDIPHTKHRLREELGIPTSEVNRHPEVMSMVQRMKQLRAKGK
eukprot:TRINITY_DN33570_c0_g1_i1.p1 TRINITY_DN33570_c0_g1~~TRINITY_DN33570_c0_g1_i1.p1  ORF type:complete len:1600 (-),score=229.24 TRINITY_DN33570_c0_g1_i1:234-4577(-)